MEMDRYVDLRRINGSRSLISSNITADETTDWVAIGPQGFNEVTVIPDFSTIATAHPYDQIDFYLQTKVQDGPAYDLLNIHFSNTHNGTTRKQPMLWRGGALGGMRGLVVTDGTLDDDEMQLGVPLGTHLRVKIVFTITGTPTLTYTCKVMLRRTDAGIALPPGKGVDIDTGVTRTVKSAIIDLSAASAATQILSGVGGRKIRVIEMAVSTDTAGTVKVQDDNGSPQELTGVIELAVGVPWVYNPVVAYPGEKYLGETQSSDDLDLLIEASGIYGGYFKYLVI
jgi:hypothetical protein